MATDFAVSVFILSNKRGLLAPTVDISYVESGTGRDWQIDAGGTRAYLIRRGDDISQLAREQGPDSHFMMRRLTSSYLIGGAGLFETKTGGRLLIVDAPAELDILPEMQGRWDNPRENTPRIAEWFGILSAHTFLRRAVDDAYLALQHPQEAFVFLYRGFEWITRGLSITVDELAGQLNVPKAHMRDLKKMSNYETGVRHASRSGVKMRADFETYATWTAGLMEAVNLAAKQVDSSFKVMSPRDIARAVAIASTVAYE